MNKEGLLKIWLDTSPTERSPYSLYGNPPMWETMKRGEMTLFTRPGRTMTRRTPYEPYTEVDGVHYQWQKDGKWYGQGYQATFEEFESYIS